MMLDEEARAYLKSDNNRKRWLARRAIFSVVLFIFLYSDVYIYIYIYARGYICDGIIYIFKAYNIYMVCLGALLFGVENKRGWQLCQGLKRLVVCCA